MRSVLIDVGVVVFVLAAAWWLLTTRPRWIRNIEHRQEALEAMRKWSE